METKASNITAHSSKKTSSRATLRNKKSAIDGNVQYVLPLGNGWVVKNSQAKKFTAITDNKKDALVIARTIAKYKQIELVIYGKDGKIQSRENYHAS